MVPCLGESSCSFMGNTLYLYFKFSKISLYIPDISMETFLVSNHAYFLLAIISPVLCCLLFLYLAPSDAKKIPMKLALPSILKKFTQFTVLLVVLYFLWLPFSFPYQWIKLKISYLLLNLLGFYPKFNSPSTNVWLGEYFSFLPYLSLMIVTYKKETKSHLKNILITLGILILMEIMGRFFSELYVFYPRSLLIKQISIFLLATARPALPFLLWFFEIQKEKNQPF
jgi:hypothetical protein